VPRCLWGNALQQQLPGGLCAMHHHDELAVWMLDEGNIARFEPMTGPMVDTV
jgi:hypothetical protein